MASIRALFESATTVDVVGVYTQDFTQVFPNARPIKATVKPQAKLMEHPLESGATITDHRIILPVEIELSLVLRAADYQDTYQTIVQYFLNATLLTVQTKTGTYTNQLIASLPHDETPDVYNTVAVALTLKQVQFANTAVTISAKNPGNSNSSSRGTQQAAPATTPQTSSVAHDFTVWKNSGKS